MKNITKDDYKRFKDCGKKFLILQNDQNYDLTKKLMESEKISLHFNLIEKSSSSKIDEDDFFNENVNELNYQEIIKYDDDQFIDDKPLTKTSELEDYPGEQIVDGLLIGETAKEYFRQNHECYDFAKYSKNMALKKTKELLFNSKYNVFFEPAFIFNNYITRCDILMRDPHNANAFIIIEVKASTCFEKKPSKVSTFNEKLEDSFDNWKLKSLKKYQHDLEYQYFVLINNNLKISNIQLMLIRSDFVKNGDVCLDDFFYITDHYFHRNKKIVFLEQSINHLLDIESDLLRMENLISKNAEPTAFLLSMQNRDCLNCLNPDLCKHITPYVKPYNVFELHRGLDKKTKLFWVLDYQYLSELSPDLTWEKTNAKGKVSTENFNDKQKRQINVTNNDDGIIESAKINQIKQILVNYKYPIYMYDFETFKSSIPVYDFSTPYQQIPFQYSVHILNNSEYDYQILKAIDHHYFIGDGIEDCRIKLAEKLVQDLTVNGKGVCVAYYASFEKGVILKLYKFFEELIKNDLYNKQKGKEIQANLKYIWENTIDLLDFFNQFYIYKKEFHGSVSIKKTLPAFAPEFTYENLKIRKGDMASETYRRLVEKNISQKIWKDYFEEPMIAYCNQDTLAMVVLFKKIEELIQKEIPPDENKEV
ncbi:DUF2779 domain-containing protein [Spiroplasma endosymbiont of Amphibalanus improvisus]|uniref:DUF2779 domain-containing protein n=1 Tax=Spiroplasma endosymbiont of Amphibalanus improvisus TaxID=3066327 RepID=UPI00313B0264